MKAQVKRIGALMLCAAGITFASCGDAADTTSTSTDSSTVTTTTPTPDTPAAPADANMNKGAKDDAEFVMKAAEANMAELDLMKSAQSHTKNADILKAAKDMIADHTKMGDAMKAYAGKKNYTLPASAPQDKKDQLAELNKKTGKDWDKAWVDMSVSDHDMVVNMFKDNNGNRQDAELNKMIADNLPTLQMHLDMSKSMQDKMK